MKKNICLFVFVLFVIVSAHAQSPESFKYQAVIRDPAGSALANRDIRVRVSLIEDQQEGAIAYREKFNARTNPYGVVNLEIGRGISDMGSFSNLEWAQHTYYIKIEIDKDGGTDYVDMGTAELLSVPYAFYAREASFTGEDNDPQNEIQTLSVNGKVLSISKANSVTLNVDDADADPGNELLTGASLVGNILRITDAGGTKSVDLSSLDDADTDAQQLAFDPQTHILVLDRGGSINLSSLINDADANSANELVSLIYIENDTLKIIEAGAMHTVDLGYLNNPGTDNQQLSFDTQALTLSLEAGGTVDLTPLKSDADADSLNEIQQLSVSESVLSISKGNSVSLIAALGGSKIEDTDFDTRIDVEASPDSDEIVFYTTNTPRLTLKADGRLHTTGNNTLLGYDAGTSLSGGQENTFMGYDAGAATITGLSNSFFGARAGNQNLSGQGNVFLGARSGQLNDGNYNTFAGNESGRSLLTGNYNVLLGAYSGFSSSAGNENVLIGAFSGADNLATGNVFVGYEVGYQNTTGSVNVFVGYKSGRENLTGGANTYVGAYSGSKSGVASNNTYIGYKAGEETLSGAGNTLIGAESGSTLDGGFNNTFVGFRSGYTALGNSNLYAGYGAGQLNQGSYNVLLGAESGSKATGASENLFAGNQSGFENLTGNRNVLLGHQTAFESTTGGQNLMAGYQAGYHTKGSGNVMLGYKAGYNETGSGKLYIANSESPLLYGDFAAKALMINGKLRVGDLDEPLEALEVKGGILVGNSNLGRVGTIRWNGTHFEGYSNQGWKELDNTYTNLLSDINGRTRIEAGSLLRQGELLFYTDSVLRLIISQDGRIEPQSGNLFVGLGSGEANLSGNSNIFLGDYAGAANSEGTGNVFIGFDAGAASSTGTSNLILGTEAGAVMLSGNQNTLLGSSAGGLFQNGNGNVMIGYSSGYGNMTGERNVFIGYEAGKNETGSQKLYIANSSTASPLIFGDFVQNQLVFNAQVGIGVALPSEKLDVQGGIRIGMTTGSLPGTIRWNGVVFQGFTGSVWKNLDYEYRHFIADTDTSMQVLLSEAGGNEQIECWLGSQRRFFFDTLRLNFQTSNTLLGTATASRIAGATANTVLGHYAAHNLTSGSENVFLGHESGYGAEGTSRSVAIGGGSNYSQSAGIDNVFVGFGSGYSRTAGQANVFVGALSGQSAYGGDSSVVVGYDAGSQANGSGNVMLGALAGQNNTGGNRNVFIGLKAGMNSSGSDLFIVANSATATPLLSGDFATGSLTVNSRLGVGITNPDESLELAGGLNVGNTSLSKAGTIRFTGSRFEGFNGVSWQLLDIQTHPSLQSSSGNAWLTLENTPGEDTLRLVLAGMEHLRYGGKAFELLGTNLFIGEKAGIGNISGSNNTFLGYKSGTSVFDGSNNLFVGYLSGTANSNGSSNVFAGAQSGQANTTGSGNLFLGGLSGFSHVSGQENSLIGYAVGFALINGSHNFFGGSYAGYDNESGIANVFIGHRAGSQGVAVDSSVLVGCEAGFAAMSGRNVMLGTRSGKNTTGGGNVFLGFEAGHDEAGSNKLYIENSSSSTPLLYGDFDADYVLINGRLGIGTSQPVEALEVAGAIRLSANTGSQPGTIRWTGSHFEGYDGSRWDTLDFQYFAYLRDGDGDTRLSLEKNSDEDTLRLFIRGIERFKTGGSAFEPLGSNVFFGQRSGKSTTGSDNTFLGFEAGRENTTGSRNYFAGSGAGKYNTTGTRNVFLGYKAGSENSGGAYNVFVGYQSGFQNVSSTSNVFVGYNAGYDHASGDSSVFIGHYAGFQSQGKANVYLGSGAGKNNVVGSGNVFLGHNAGADASQSNRLYVHNSADESPLLYGEFDNRQLEINGSLTVTNGIENKGNETVDGNLEVNGTTSLGDVLRLAPQATPPSSPQIGDMYFGTDEQLRIYTSSGWKTVALN